MDARLWLGVRTKHITLCLVPVLVASSQLNCGRADAPDSERAANPGVPVLLTVAPFEAGDSVPQQWNPGAFADSLAARLRLLPNVNVSVSPDARAADGFALRGTVSVRNGRLMVGARLSHAGDPSPAWTATFWRSDGPLSGLVDVVASGAAEALGAEIHRRSITKK